MTMPSIVTKKPTESGFYWVLAYGEWTVAQVSCRRDLHGKLGRVVDLLCSSESLPFDEFYGEAWGPKIEPPDDFRDHDLARRESPAERTRERKVL